MKRQLQRWAGGSHRAKGGQLWPHRNVVTHRNARRLFLSLSPCLPDQLPWPSPWDLDTVRASA